MAILMHQPDIVRVSRKFQLINPSPSIAKISSDQLLTLRQFRMSPSILSDMNESSVFLTDMPVVQKEDKFSSSAHGAVPLPPVAQQFTPPPSRFVAECHPLEKQITAEVDGFFLTHWPFKTAKDRKKFVQAGFSRVTCLYFPLSMDDRIHLACRLLTILFLIDGIC